MGIEAIYNIDDLHPDDFLGILTSETKWCGIVNNYPIRRQAVPYEAVDMYANNNRTFRVFVKTPDLNIVDLTGATGIFTVKTTKTGTPLIQKSTAVPGEGMIGAADEGEMFFYILPADTSSLDIRQYVFDVRVTLSSGNSYTVLEGVMNLLQPVD